MLGVLTALVVVVGSEAGAASPSLTAPERIYTHVNTMTPFTGTDTISDDNKAISVELTDAGGDCNPTAGNSYDITTCPRVQMDVNHGTLAIDVQTNLSTPGLPDGVASGGAIFESTNADGTGKVINLNGTTTQLNAALATLTYTPDNNYENDDTTPDDLLILAIDEDQNTTNVAANVEIRVDQDNQGPTLTVPPTQNVAASSVTDLPAVAPPVASPPNAGDWNVTDPDIKDGTPDDMLISIWTTCGTFSMRGASLPIEGGLTSNLDTYIEGLYGTDAAYQADRDAMVAGIIAALPPEVATAPNDGTAPNVEKTGYSGIGTIDDVVYMLSQISFHAPATKGNCDLWTVVTDLGNDGLPLKYIGSPLGGIDTPQPGMEAPDLKIAQDYTTFVVDGGVKLSVPANLTVAEGSTLDIPVSIDSSKHPDIPMGFSTVDVSTTGADYAAPPATLFPADDAGPVNATFTALTDADVEVDEFVYVTVEVNGDGVTADPDTVLVKITDTTATTTTASTTTTDPGGSTSTIVVTVPETSTTTTSTPDTTTSSTTTSSTTTTTTPNTTTSSTTTSSTTTTTPNTTTSSTTTSTSTTTTTTPNTTTSSNTPSSTTTTTPNTTTSSTTTTTPNTTTSTPGSTTTTPGSTTTTTGSSSTTTTDGSTTSTTDGSTTSTTGGGGATTTTDGSGVSSGGTDQDGDGNVDSGTLARTGSTTSPSTIVGVGLILLGSGVLLARRRLQLRQG
ncbi:MAG: LPXTG cell wall anchor domain-containing protein [Acidimicrobiales bacterium]